MKRLEQVWVGFECAVATYYAGFAFVCARSGSTVLMILNVAVAAFFFYFAMTNVSGEEVFPILAGKRRRRR